MAEGEKIIGIKSEIGKIDRVSEEDSWNNIT
jgi:hypothetical protein